MEANGAVAPAPERVAIVALGPSAYDYIQFCDRNGNRHNLFDETWTVNTFSSIIQSDRLFHMDDFRIQLERAKGNSRVAAMLEALKRYPGPIYTSVPHLDWPQCVKYPIQEVIAKFGSMYFNNTMPYVIAYAMFIGVKKLTLFGLDYSWPDIAGAEAGRGCTEYWLGLAHAYGIEYRVCPSSTLMDARSYKDGYFPMYGYDAFKIKMEPVEKGKIKLIWEDVALPSAEEIEKRYFRDRPKDLEAILGEYHANAVGEERHSGVRPEDAGRDERSKDDDSARGHGAGG